MKQIIFILLILPFSLLSQQDYAKHYMVSVNLSSFVGSSTYYVTKKPLISALAGLGASFLVGMGKEFIWDERMGKGTKSGLDLDADLRGSLTGAFFTFVITNTIDKKRNTLDSLKYCNLAKKSYEQTRTNH